MNVGIIGAGAWGTALGHSVSSNADNVILWSYDGGVKEFDDVGLSKNIKVSMNLSDLRDVDVILIVTPSAFFRETLKNYKPFYNNQPIIICTKGVERETNCLMSEIVAEILPECREIGVLSGPQFAAEVANNLPTGGTLAGSNKVQEIGRIIFSNFFIQETDDVIGVQICGFGKNILALVMGYLSIKTNSENRRAMLFTRFWDEVVQYGLHRGARLQTFMLLCGLGDLYLSATSKTSRNYAAGAAIAGGFPPLGTVEGLSALKGMLGYARANNINLPLCDEIESDFGL